MNDASGVYNSVDIENALNCGYKVTIIEGYYWENTAKLFLSYIEFLYKFKKEARKGTAQYTLAKLMMNGLYGKTIQRPILDENVIIRLHAEFIKYHIKYGGVTMKPLRVEAIMLPIKIKINLQLKLQNHFIWGVLYWDTVE